MLSYQTLELHGVEREWLRTHDDIYEATLTMTYHACHGGDQR